jgi:hypothetical protein
MGLSRFILKLRLKRGHLNLSKTVKPLLGQAGSQAPLTNTPDPEVPEDLDASGLEEQAW